MKNLLIIIALLSTATFANKEGEALHNKTCVACHVVQHDDNFYMRQNRKIISLPKLSGQVSRCAQAFNTGWFPDEEQAVVDYLNKKYYQFKH
ncbi:hypothetical protein BTHERMOSOX_927 [Bathymodiolus thermophilus thioautotrophic gill symbiont]|jgi:cytochrome c2|uniref:Cytochrome c domain-containing protein n=1 Tax=Bathymodiolus thermophilus thioautotrophic gill symbiont TaxID=2360 RepID=A0A1J5TVY9_9GAMM|nr:hypothetical protein [Bathymodiolus thermophilus thioautotrophic gill symbiont]AYQ56529.1 hypothetical protein MS2017_0801 [Bathymodiolus thermophilus thioautotrophic gill symbiont]OIR24356.1 hypothetical protein BGC33_10175 [Bathymodiolus thermophilus thioautotrophic gill symbiont]CAB5501076.1 hypothetical protein THERMOS_1329 [Bathymodiolus thermophilus thioautotrophic gill symbiont]CAB5502952.1 hypothetical protein THERMOT_1710 [Bathymodiolus thermophilus thioautotrophic gill symbiont]SG